MAGSFDSNGDIEQDPEDDLGWDGATTKYDRLNQSFIKDNERWIDSYTDHSATALHNRTLIHSNGNLS